MKPFVSGALGALLGLAVGVLIAGDRSSEAPAVGSDVTAITELTSEIRALREGLQEWSAATPRDVSTPVPRREPLDGESTEMLAALRSIEEALRSLTTASGASDRTGGFSEHPRRTWARPADRGALQRLQESRNGRGWSVAGADLFGLRPVEVAQRFGLPDEVNGSDGRVRWFYEGLGPTGETLTISFMDGYVSHVDS